LPSYEVTINERTCIGCSVCVQICPTEVFKIIIKRDGEYKRLVSIVEREEACIGCMACVENCPTESIRVRNLKVEKALGASESLPSA
jgi:NAD-dependent dihydropyrimidine dehydrogenase PreA subunit